MCALWVPCIEIRETSGASSPNDRGRPRRVFHRAQHCRLVPLLAAVGRASAPALKPPKPTSPRCHVSREAVATPGRSGLDLRPVLGRGWAPEWRVAVPAAVRNRRLVIVPEHTRELGGFMDLKRLQRTAKQLIDRRGGTDSLKADAEELKDIAKGPGSVADKAKRAGDALKDPGAKDPDTPVSPRPPATDTPAATAERTAAPAPEADAPGTPKPGPRPAPSVGTRRTTS